MTTDGQPADTDRPMGRVYAGVFVLEAAVLAAIWLVQRWFGG